MTELIPTRIRSTGISIAYNIPVAVFGGCAPFVAAWLITTTGDITAPWFFFVGTGVVSLAALLVLHPNDFRRGAGATVSGHSVPADPNAQSTVGSTAQRTAR